MTNIIETTKLVSAFSTKWLNDFFAKKIIFFAKKIIFRQRDKFSVKKYDLSTMKGEF